MSLLLEPPASLAAIHMGGYCLNPCPECGRPCGRHTGHPGWHKHGHVRNDRAHFGDRPVRRSWAGNLNEPRPNGCRKRFWK